MTDNINHAKLTHAAALKMIGKGSQYVYNARGEDGNYLEGDKIYKLNRSNYRDREATTHR